MTKISTKNLTSIARQWRRLARIKRITLPIIASPSKEEKTLYATSPKTEKGHFVVYTADSRRFVLPLVYLDNSVFQELLRFAEEEFGLPRDRPLTLPFDSVFMDYLIWLIKRNVANDILEKALLTSIDNMPTSRCCLLSPYPSIQDVENPHLVIQGF